MIPIIHQRFLFFLPHPQNYDSKIHSSVVACTAMRHETLILVYIVLDDIQKEQAVNIFCKIKLLSF